MNDKSTVKHQCWFGYLALICPFMEFKWVFMPIYRKLFIEARDDFCHYLQPQTKFYMESRPTWVTAAFAIAGMERAMVML